MNILSSLSSTPPAIIGAILGFVTVIVGHRFNFWLKQRSRRSKLRAGFLAEIQTPKHPIDELASLDSVSKGEIDYTTIPREMYESQSSEIGILSKEEVEAIVEYYSLTAVAKEQIEAISKGNSVSNFEKTRDGLKEARDDAEEVLSNHPKSKMRYLHMLFE